MAEEEFCLWMNHNSTVSLSALGATWTSLGLQLVREWANTSRALGQGDAFCMQGGHGRAGDAGSKCHELSCVPKFICSSPNSKYLRMVLLGDLVFEEVTKVKWGES